MSNHKPNALIGQYGSNPFKTSRMDPLSIASVGMGALQSVGNIFTAGANRRAQQKENEKQRQWSREMYDLQNQRDIEFWNMQNAYNDPLAQMQRLGNAGLNPHLVYGNGADTQAGPIATHSAPQPNTKAPQFAPLGDAITSGLFSFLDVQQKKANVARTDAETEAITANTANREFLNKLNTDSYLSMLRKNMANQVNKGHYDAESSRVNYEKLSTLIDTDPELYKSAVKAGLERTILDVELAKTIGDERKASTALKQFELQLNKQGIFRGDNTFFRLFNSIFNQVFGQSVVDGLPTPSDFKNRVNSIFK